jgi:hypothetical protein
MLEQLKELVGGGSSVQPTTSYSKFLEGGSSRRPNVQVRSPRAQPSRAPSLHLRSKGGTRRAHWDGPTRGGFDNPRLAQHFAGRTKRRGGRNILMKSKKFARKIPRLYRGGLSAMGHSGTRGKRRGGSLLIPRKTTFNPRGGFAGYPTGASMKRNARRGGMFGPQKRARRPRGGGSVVTTAALPFGLLAVQKLFQTRKGRKGLKKMNKSVRRNARRVRRAI